MSRPVNPEIGLFRLSPGDPGAAQAPRSLTTVASALLHALALLAVVAVPLLQDDSLPVRARQAEAFFASPLELAPPPPPPPPAASRVAARALATTRQPVSFVAPVEVPTEIATDAGLDLGVEGGMPGGVEGGVPGGLVGGVVGGLPEAAPPPPVQPVRVGQQIKEPRKIKNVAPVYPSLAERSRLEGVVILECLLDPRGRVVDVKVLRGLPLLDDAAVEAVRQWVYTPTLINGVPTPVILTVTVNFRLTSAR